MIIRPSRHRPEVGDLFALNMQGKTWVAGRVIRINAKGLGPMTNENLLYFYRHEVSDPEAIRTPLRPALLIAPVMTNDLG